MADENPVQSLQEEATCSICLEYYNDPVITECGHNFCRACITECWEGAGTACPCPQCRQMCPRADLRPNRLLLSMVQSVKQLSLRAGSPQEDLCERHEQKLQLYCREDQELICVVCRESQQHRSHSAVPADEAAQEYKSKLRDWLPPLRIEMESILDSKVKEEKEYKTMRSKLDTERLKMMAELYQLHQLLKEQEQTLIRRLEEMKEKITMAENAKTDRLSSQLSSLSALITEIEEKRNQPAAELLKDVRSTITKYENVKLQNPMAIMNTYRVRVTLDPDTASQWLILSEDGRRVRNTAEQQPAYPRSFTNWPSVLGSKGFSSGRHYWELQLLQGSGWIVGVTRESVLRKAVLTVSPEEGVWAVLGYHGQYEALTSPRSPLLPFKPPRKLGLYLDYEGGRLFLYNANTREELCAFTSAAFNERVFPYFRIRSGAELRLV